MAEGPEDALMEEFVEFEGFDDQKLLELQDMGGMTDNDVDEDDFQPVQASALQASELYYEMEKRALKTTGFPDTDREILQKAFNEEFERDLEQMKERRRRAKMEAAKHRGLMRRRHLMEQTLRQEQDALGADPQVEHAIQMVQQHQTPATIRLDVNSVTARVLAKSMWSNRNITCLDVSNNGLNDHAGCYLARMLKRNRALVKLELDSNQLGPDSCKAFGEALNLNRTLSYLSLESNPLTSDATDFSGIEALMRVLRDNESLTYLSLWRTQLNEEGGQVVAEALEDNHTVLFLDVGHNFVAMQHRIAIANKLQSNMSRFETAEELNARELESHRLAELRSQEEAEAEAKAREKQRWLDEQRAKRADARRQARFEEYTKEKEEEEERRKEEAARLEAERKAKEEAEAKKKKKAAKKK